MSGIYESVPTFEDENFLLRFVRKEDAEDLLEVYGDKNALPFFNGDNCHGDNFHYTTLERMREAVDFWLESYEKKWFVRWAVVEKLSGTAVGTAELFRRESDDDFGGCAVLRLDLRSRFEVSHIIEEIARLLVGRACAMFGAERLITKIPAYAVERMAAFGSLGFKKSDKLLVGTADGYAYKDYWEKTAAKPS